MGTREKAAARASSGIDKVLQRHKALNPDRGLTVLIAIDEGTGQLFLCSAKGTIAKREEAIGRNLDDRCYGRERR